METIGEHKIWTIDGNGSARSARHPAPRKGTGCLVGSFLELATKIAELQFRNRDYVLLFRGQSGDFRNRAAQSTLKPTLFRAAPDGHSPPGPGELESRFIRLREAEQRLVQHYRLSGFPGVERLERQRILRWSILQHYEICPTPLLDVTHSLRIAASFASIDVPEAFVFVLGVPNLSGAITASAEAGLQIVRLSSVCPPSAVRPHIQEGYLLGEYPELTDFSEKANYGHQEIDFGHRLVAKFRFCPATFWRDPNFPRVNRDALYPPRDQDPLFDLALKIATGTG